MPGDVRHLLAVTLVLIACIGCRRSEDAGLNADSSIFQEAGSTRDSIVRDDTGASDTARDASRDCGIDGTPLLADEGIGELKQGRPVVEVTALCEVMSDSQQRGAEGMMERVLVVRIADELVRAVVAGDRIFRIEINTPRFRTPDSLGVDTPLKRIAAMRGAQFAPGEDGVYGFSPSHCGLSFRFALPLRPPAGGQWTAASISQRHGDAAVNRVIVIACTR